MARQYRQCYPLLPYAGPQLCLQCAESFWSPNCVLNVLQRTTSSLSSVLRRTKVTGNGLPVTLHQVALLVPHHYSSSIPWTTPVRAWPMMQSPPRVEEPVNSTDWLMCTRKRLRQMALLVSTVVSCPQLPVSSCTVVFTSVYTTHSVRIFPNLLDLYKLTFFCRARRPCWWPWGFVPCFLRSGMGCYYWLWARFIPSGYYPVRLLRYIL